MARETAEQRREREALEATTAPQPTEMEPTTETATDDAPEGLNYGEPRLVDLDGEPRTYADALTPEHAERLREFGQHPDQQE